MIPVGQILRSRKISSSKARMDHGVHSCAYAYDWPSSHLLLIRCAAPSFHHVFLRCHHMHGVGTYILDTLALSQFLLGVWDHPWRAVVHKFHVLRATNHQGLNLGASTFFRIYRRCYVLSGKRRCVDDEVPLVNSRIFKSADTQSFGGAHRRRVCIRVLI